MREAKKTPPIIPYANRDTDATFQCSESLVYIYNSNGRLHAYIGGTITAVLIACPFVRAMMPGTVWLAFDEPGAAGWFGLLVYLCVIFLSASASFWWSTVRIDLKTGQVLRECRWGLFKKSAVAPLRDFNQLRLEHDDGNTSIFLAGSQRMQIVWGRNSKESARVARELAARLGLPLSGDEDR